jgi:hypothetical protein
MGTAYFGNRMVASDYTARAVGAVVQFYALVAGNGVTAVLYSGNSAIATSAERDTDYTSQVGGYLYIPFSTPVIIQRGVTYDLMVYRSSGSSTTNLYGYTAGAAADIGLMEYGTNIYGVTCTGTCATATNRTAQATKRYNIHLVIDAIYAGGGGFLVVQ